jgi:hypothetical protein
MDSAAATFDNFLNQREAHAAAFHSVSRFQRLEHSEDLVVVRLRNARPVVLHNEFDMVTMIARRNLNPAIRPIVMLDRIADQVAQHLIERSAVAQKYRHRADCNGKGFRQRQALDDFAGQLTGINVSHVSVATAYARIFQHVVEQRLHSFDASLHQIEIFADVF